jgi:hypothetical protein
MTPKRATFVLTGILILIVFAGGAAFYLGDKMLQAKSAEISQQKAELEAVQTEVQIFQDSKEKVEKYGFVNDLAGKILPESKFQSEVVAELTQFATANNISIQALTFTGGDAANADPNLSQTDTVEGLPGVRVLGASMQFTTEPPINYSDFLNFLRRVETNQRKMQVTTLSITPNPEDPSTIASATVSVNIFLKDTAPAPKKEAKNEN